jgi:predicted dehydrogenase
MIANFHARAIKDIRGARVVACYDRTPAKADRFATEHGCRPYNTLSAMLSNSEIDVVTVCTASGAHREPAVAAARAGKHVIVEKPLEVTLRRCDDMIRECQRAKVKLSTIFQSRFHDASKELKRAVDQRRFGRITLAEAYVKWYRSQAYYDSGAWRGTWEFDGGGALMNQAIHSVDLLAWFMGPAVEVRAHAALLAHERIEVEDTAVATLKFANGALGVIEASTAVYPGSLKRIEIHGSEGTAAMAEEDVVEWKFARRSRADAAVEKRMAERISTAGGVSDPAAIGHHGHALQFRDVLSAIREDRPCAIDGREGRRSVEIILAIYKAAETGRTVTLPLAADPVLKARKRKRSVG